MSFILSVNSSIYFGNESARSFTKMVFLAYFGDYLSENHTMNQAQIECLKMELSSVISSKIGESISTYDLVSKYTHSTLSEELSLEFIKNLGIKVLRGDNGESEECVEPIALRFLLEGFLESSHAFSLDKKTLLGWEEVLVLFLKGKGIEDLSHSQVLSFIKERGEAVRKPVKKFMFYLLSDRSSLLNRKQKIDLQKIHSIKLAEA